MLHFMARRTTTRYPQAGAKALTSPRVPPILFSFSDAPMAAQDFGFNTVRRDSRSTSVISHSLDLLNVAFHGPADDDALPASGRQGANESARPAYLVFVLRCPDGRAGFWVQYGSEGFAQHVSHIALFGSFECCISWPGGRRRATRKRAPRR